MCQHWHKIKLIVLRKTFKKYVLQKETIPNGIVALISRLIALSFKTAKQDEIWGRSLSELGEPEPGGGGVITLGRVMSEGEGQEQRHTI